MLVAVAFGFIVDSSSRASLSPSLIKMPAYCDGNPAEIGVLVRL